jgi:hypothetical protein
VHEPEADCSALLIAGAEIVLEALDGPSSEEHSKVYRMLQLEVRPEAEAYAVSAALLLTRLPGAIR